MKSHVHAMMTNLLVLERAASVLLCSLQRTVAKLCLRDMDYFDLWVRQLHDGRWNLLPPQL